MTEELKPCPFCGERAWPFGCDQIGWEVVCGNCGAKGPGTFSRQMAVWNWNYHRLGKAVDPESLKTSELKEEEK